MSDVMTVLGPVEPERLGITLPHEHLLIDLSCLWHPPAFEWQEPLVDAPLALETRGLLARDPYLSRPNLLLDDLDAAVEEASVFRAMGGGTIVDLTTQGIAPQPLALREIARRTGLHVVAGCGVYVRRAHPPRVAEASEAELAEDLIRDVVEGFGETGIRPGIIGEIGTSSPIHPDELKMLRASAQAGRATGLAINVHVAIFARQALNALDVLEEAGADLSRVVISHLDERLEIDYHQAVLRRGAYVEFDTFGSELSFDSSGEREPSDGERINALLGLLERGWAEQLLLSQDVCIKMQLLRYGGFGYAHLLRSIVPLLYRRGVDEATIHTLMVKNPARILTRAE